MKVDICDDDLLIHLNNYYIKSLNIYDINNLEKYLKKLFIKINKKYDIQISGYYIIDIYIDKNYGIIISMKKQELEYYEYFNEQIDTKITIHNDEKFLYKINDYLDIKKMNFSYSLYKFNNGFYLIINNITEKDFNKIIEFCSDICICDKKIVNYGNLLYNN